MTEEKKGFKKVDAQFIPEDWEVVQLGDIINYTKGFAFKSAEYSDSGVRIVRVSDVKKGEIKKEGGVFIPHTQSSKYSSWALKADDIIVSTVGSKPPLYESIVGKPYLVKESESGYLLNQNAVKLRVNDDSKYSQDLLYHHFEVRSYYEHIEDIFRGNANQASITLEGLFKYKISLPPTLEEQQAIASALSDVDDLIRSLDRLIQKKEAIKKGTMQQLLTGKKRLPGFDGEWEVKTLGDVLTVCHGKSQKQVESAEGKYPILATGGQIGKASKFLYDKPSVLIGRKGTIDRPQYIDKPFWTIDTLFYTEIKKNAIAKFLYYKFLLIDWRSYNEASGVPSLNSSTIENVEIKLPSELDEQKAIVDILDDMDRELQTLRQKREKYKHVKQGMMQELLTGKVRLV